MGTVEEVWRREDCYMCYFISRFTTWPPDDWEYIKDEEVWLWTKPSRFVLQARRSMEGRFRLWHIGHQFLLPESSKNTSSEDRRKADHAPSVLGRRINWNQVNSWLKECRRYHQPCNSDRAGFWDPQFRVIDVHKRMVTALPDSQCKFVALSYVWGTGPENEKAQLTKETIEMFETPGGLSDLPATIQDAIKVCVQLRQRFLWVDRLCIVQDSDDKLHQVKSMGQIYSSADLVIVAACGEGANDGLRGVSRRRAENQIQARVLAFEFTYILPELEKALRWSKWASRGWTCQEAILAKRKLYFTKSEVWFVCQDGGHREDQYGIEERLKDGPGAAASRIRLSSPFQDYCRLADQYTGRTLGNQSDIYNAFSGIQDMLYPDTRAIYGLPELDFDKALLWSVPDESMRLDHRIAQGTVLPSWSWSSIEGQIHYTEKDLGTTTCLLVRWALFDQGTLRSLNSADYTELWADRWNPGHAQTSLAIAWTAGCIEADSPFEFREMEDEDWEMETPFSVSTKDLERRWPTPRDFWAEVDLKSASNGFNQFRVQEIASHNEDVMKYLQHPGVLLTRAQIAHFNVHMDCRRKELSIWHDGGWLCAGELISFDEFKLRTGMRDRDTRRTEFMALSVGRPPSERWYSYREGELKYYGYSTPDCNRLIPPPILIVMAIDREGPFSRRLGIGHIYLKRWAMAMPKFETILLR